MPRPQRCRRVCGEPEYDRFSPCGISQGSPVTLSLDEYEAIRLVDLLGNTHEQCARQMEVSRTTVTEIYERARRKLAECIVGGRELWISGGNYRLCDGSASQCCGHRCRRASSGEGTSGAIEKGENRMRIAVTFEDGQIFQHFGHTEQFKLYDVEDGRVVRSQVVGTQGSGHGALAGFLAGNQVDALICGGIGGGAQQALSQAGIKLCGGVSGPTDEAVEKLLAGTLEYSADAQCSHHEHSCEGHTCGEEN